MLVLRNPDKRRYRARRRHRRRSRSSAGAGGRLAMAVLALDRSWRKPPLSRGAGPLTIGIVNNMPDAALKFTELQLRDLLSRAAGRREVLLRTFSLPEV